jgi:hypothetical protein
MKQKSWAEKAAKAVVRYDLLKGSLTGRPFLAIDRDGMAWAYAEKPTLVDKDLPSESGFWSAHGRSIGRLTDAEMANIDWRKSCVDVTDLVAAAIEEDAK